MIVGIDPGLRCTGIAAMDANRLLSWHRITTLHSADLGMRVAWIMDEMSRVLHEIRSEHGRLGEVVIETPARQSPDQRRRGQALYGVAVGVCVAHVRWLRYDLGSDIILTPADDWTRRRSKPDRAAIVEAAVDGYRRRDDPGLDVADAIGLCLWWESERLVRRA